MRPVEDGASETSLEVLLRLANEQPGRRPEFYQALLESPVLLASPDSGSGGKSPRITALLTPEGEQVIPFFTSSRALREALPHTRYCAPLPARELFEITRGHMLHLNPGSMFGRTFTAEEIASLLSTGMIAQAVPERFALESPVEIGEAETPPPVLITALTDLYSRTPEVEAAFLAQVGGQAAGTIQKHLLIALEMKSRVERVIHATATVVREVDEVQNYLIDVVVFDLTSDLSWAQAIRAHLKPFYQSRWGSRILLTNPGQPS